MVRVLMPATSVRPYRVDLLCGRHFRLSQWTLAATGAVAQILPAGVPRLTRRPCSRRAFRP